MNDQLAVFHFGNNHPVRIVEHECEPWFVAKDVCSVLHLNNVTEAIRALDDDEKDGFKIADSIGRQQKTPIISESGLYALVIRSNKPEAKAFRKWVTSDVLPAIRRDGAYAAPEVVSDAIPAVPERTQAEDTPPLFPEPKHPLPEEVRDGFGHWMNWNGKRIVCTSSIAAMLGLSRPQVEGVFWSNRTLFIKNEDYFKRGTVKFRDLCVADANYAPCINARIAGNSRFFTLSGLVKLVNLGRGRWRLNDPDRALPPPESAPMLPATVPARRVKSNADDEVKAQICTILGTVNAKIASGVPLDASVLSFAENLAQLAYRK